MWLGSLSNFWTDSEMIITATSYQIPRLFKYQVNLARRPVVRAQAHGEVRGPKPCIGGRPRLNEFLLHY